MKKKFISVFFVVALCVLAFLHVAFIESENESDVRLRDVETLSASEGSSGGCNATGGWCFIGGVPKKGMHIL